MADDFIVGHAAVDVVPDVSRFRKELQAKLKGVTAEVGVTADVSRLREQLATATRTKPVEVDVKAEGTKAASAEIAAAARDRTARIKVKTHGFAQTQRNISAVMGGIFSMGAAISALGALAVPAIAAIGGAVLALLGPLAAATAGVGALAAAVIGNVKRAMKATGKLSAPVRAFKDALDGAKKAWNKFLDATQGAALGLATKALRLFSRLIVQFAPLANAAARAVGRLLAEFGKWTKSAAAQGFLKFFQSEAGLAIRRFGHIVGNVALGLVGLARAFAPLGNAMLAGLEKLTAKFASFGKSANKNGGVKQFIAYIKRVGPQVVDFFGNLVGALVQIGKFIAPVGLGMLKMANGIAKFIAHAKPKTLALIAGGIGAIGVAITLATGGLNLLIPSLIALAASLIYAYKHSSKFRKIVNAVGHAFRAVGKVIRHVWNKYIHPALHALWKFIKRQVWPVIVALWHQVVKPIMRDMGHAIAFFWKHYAKPALKAFAEFIRKVVWPTIKWLWKHLRPSFFAMGKVIKWVWDHIIKPAFKALDHFIRKILAPTIAWFWKKVIVPAWNKIGNAIKWAWHKVIKPTFGKLKDGVKAAGEAFRKAKDAIGKAWSKIKQLARKPVAFVINHVVRPLVSKFNQVGKHLGIKLPMPDKFSRGGTVGGRRAPYGDKVLAHLAPGEEVISNRHGEADQFRADRAAGRIPAYAGGGTVWPAVGQRHKHSGYPWATWAGDVNVPGSGDYGNPVRAYKDGVIAKALRWNYSYGHHIIENLKGGGSALYAHLSKILVHAGEHVRAGQLIGRVGQTGNATGPHLHFEIRGAKANFAGAHAGASGKVEAPWYSKLGHWAKSMLASPAKKLMGFIEGPLNTLKSKFGDNSITQLAAAVPKKIVGGLKDKITDFLEDHPTHVPGFEGISAAGLNLSGKANRAIVKQIAARKGWGKGAQWRALVNLIMSESGFNNTAQNPISTAYGMFQFLDGTWSTVGGHKTSDPVKQTVYGLRYIAKRYGNPIRAWAYHRAHNSYARGTSSASPGWALVGERGPELVHMRGGERVVPNNEIGNVRGSGGVTNNFNGPIYTVDPNEAARKIQRKQEIGLLKASLAS